MKVNSTQEQHLREEIRWAREALAIAEMQEQSMSFSGIAESRKECMPFEHRHMCDWDTDDIERFIELRQRDLEHLKEGEF